MVREIETEGNSVEEAIKAALVELGADRDSVEIEVLEEGSRGFLGISAAKARVRVSVAEGSSQPAATFVKELIDKLGASGDVDVSEDSETININITGPNAGLLIGKRGETLAAIQTITGVVLRKNNIKKKLVLDVEDYRKRRAESLTEIAISAAEKALSIGRPVVLQPMNSFERRLVHLALQDNDEVITISEGEEPSRQVRVAPR
ncbi:MAG: RNA-binding cell elongation regulator Jag/EloR [Actinomycetota bacterium]|nr:RNA-binding cell elongation regulator Jag/EloR [Actinomycetota bacterium]